MTTKNIQALEATLAALTARVAELEAAQCRCAHCEDSARSRHEQRNRERANALQNMPAAERNATIHALTVSEQYEILPLIVDKVRVMLEAGDLADEIRAPMRLTQYERDQIRVAMMDLAPRVNVMYADARYREAARGPIKEQAIRLEDEDEADRVRAAGLRVSKDHDDVYWYHRPELRACYPELLASTWDLMLALDHQLRAAVETGLVVATPLTDEELRLSEIRRMSERRESQITYRTTTNIAPGSY